MALHPNTSANYNHAADVSVGSRPQVTLHASIFNLLGRYTVFAFEHRRGACVLNILPRLLAAYYHKFITPMTGVNSSEDTLNFITQRFPIFFQQLFPFYAVFKQYSTKEIQDVGKITQEFGQITQGP